MTHAQAVAVSTDLTARRIPHRLEVEVGVALDCNVSTDPRGFRDFTDMMIICEKVAVDHNLRLVHQGDILIFGPVT